MKKGNCISMNNRRGISTKPFMIAKMKAEENKHSIRDIPDTMGNKSSMDKATNRIINGGALLNLNITPHSSKVQNKNSKTKLNSLKISL